jgi:hypothetical protein
MTMLPSTDPQLDKLRNGRPPMPLPTRGVEEAQALRLCVEDGLSYPGIASVMGRYHGAYYSADHWRHVCRSAGAPPRRPDTFPPQVRALRGNGGRGA